MKKNILTFVLIVTIICAAVLPVYAVENDPHTIKADDGSTIIYFDDGSILKVSRAITDEEIPSTYATAKTISSHRDVTYTDSNGNVDWKYTLYGTFSYVPGVSSTCTSASYTQNIYDNDWKFSNGSATKSGNTAYGAGKYVLKFLLFDAKTYNIDISLTCDVNGNVT